MIEFTAWLSAKIVIHIAIAFYGLSTYIVVLYPLIRFRKANFSTPFYTICFALAFTDTLSIILNIISTITDPLKPVADLQLLRLQSFISRCCWYGTSCCHILIALERTTIVFCKPGSKLVMKFLYCYCERKVCIAPL